MERLEGVTGAGGWEAWKMEKEEEDQEEEEEKEGDFCKALVGLSMALEIRTQVTGIGWSCSRFSSVQRKQSLPAMKSASQSRVSRHSSSLHQVIQKRREGWRRIQKHGGVTEEEHGRQQEAEVKKGRREIRGGGSVWEFWVNHSKPGSPLYFFH